MFATFNYRITYSLLWFRLINEGFSLFFNFFLNFGHFLIVSFLFLFFFFFAFAFILLISMCPNFLLIFFFFREFQPMASAPDDSSLSSNQDTNQFLV